MRKLSKLIVVFVFILALFNTQATGILAEDLSGVEEGFTVGDGERLLFEHLEKSGISLEIGTNEYIDYLLSILIEDSDQKLKEHPYYNIIRTYASTYLTELDNAQSIKPVSEGYDIEQSIKEKPISQHLFEIDRRNKIIEEEISKNKNNEEDFSTYFYYDNMAAASYARNWGNGRNPEYNNHLKDCTNFVSQAVFAGGKPKHYIGTPASGINKTTTYWYSIKYQEWRNHYPVDMWRESSSWINVSDFFTYWSSKLTYANFSNRSGVISYASVGDIIQLQDQSGNWYHSIIVTKKENGKLYYSGHSTNRVDQEFTVSDVTNNFRVIKFAGTRN